LTRAAFHFIVKFDDIIIKFDDTWIQGFQYINQINLYTRGMEAGGRCLKEAGHPSTTTLLNSVIIQFVRNADLVVDKAAAVL